jgi:hypothetical protein
MSLTVLLPMSLATGFSAEARVRSGFGPRGISNRELDDLKDRREYSHLKEEALDRTMWRNRFGRGVGPVVRLLNELMNESYPRVFCVRMHALAQLGTDTVCLFFLNKGNIYSLHNIHLQGSSISYGY